MLLLLPILFFCCVKCDYDSKTLYYHSYHGTRLSEEQLLEHEKHNTTFWCVSAIKPCKASEGRRVDGSCNNPQYPSRGASHTPFYRVLPAAYSEGFDIRKARSGKPLPPARLVRTTLLTQGQRHSQKFTHLISHAWAFSATDMLSIHDTVNYLGWRPYCCEPKGKTDPMCAPNEVPPNDPVLQFSDVRCMVMTKPISYQSTGCLANNTEPERQLSTTTTFDLSTIYGSLRANLLKARLFRGGLLKYDLINGRVWPPAMEPEQAKESCFLNQRPTETRCHNTPTTDTNSLLGVSVITVWLWRLHNFIAKQLAKVNPCWTDEKLFNTARDINIALVMQVNFYEMLPEIMGRENLIRSGVIMSTPGFRDIYDKSLFPQISLEFPYVLRWAHTFQSDFIDMYDSKGNFLKRTSAVNGTARTGFLAIDNNLEYVTHGMFRQGSGDIDYSVDSEIANRGLGAALKAFDITTNDLAKGRHFGFQPYIKYKEYCSQCSYIKDFDDLSYDIDAENIESLKESFKYIEEIDLLAGIWMEKKVEGGHVPPTLYCLVVEQLLRSIQSDRHWYERPNRPYAYTYPQLLEIRKATIAMILCLVGDNVSRIQPRAFLKENSENKICSCKYIKKINFAAWKDNAC